MKRQSWVTYTINSNWRIYVRAKTIKFLQETRVNLYDLVTGNSFLKYDTKNTNDKRKQWIFKITKIKNCFIMLMQIKTTIQDFPSGLVVCAFTVKGWVQSLVGEVRTQKHTVGPKTNKQKIKMTYYFIPTRMARIKKDR